jgi:hypothetical protein
MSLSADLEKLLHPFQVAAEKAVADAKAEAVALAADLRAIATSEIVAAIEAEKPELDALAKKVAEDAAKAVLAAVEAALEAHGL